MDAWSKVLRDVDVVTSRLLKNGCDIPFFRGHGDGSWTLMPALGRKSYYEGMERVIFYDISTRAGSLISPSTTSWDLLFIARHHGLPTRLLDWTEVFSVALFFACRDFSQEATIWVLDPFSLNKAAVKNAAILHPDTDLDHSYFEYFITERARLPGNAMAILPNKSNARIAAQRGVFTLHRDPEKALEGLFPKTVARIEVSREALPGAIRFLEFAGVNEYSLFPDLDGLARWMRKVHGL